MPKAEKDKKDLEEAKKFAQLCKKQEKKFVDFVGAKHYYQASKKSYEMIKRPLYFIPAQLYRAGWEQKKMRTLELMRSKNDRPMRYVSSNTVCAGCEVFEKDLFDYIDSAHPDITQSIRDTKDLTGENEERLKEALNEYVEKFLKSK